MSSAPPGATHPEGTGHPDVLQPPTVVFVDLETTGLEPLRHDLWEIALVELDDTEDVWAVWPDLARADPMALTMNRFYQRPMEWETPAVVAEQLAQRLAGRILAGAAPWFDASFLDVFLRRNGHCPTWSHRLLCVETYAAGCLGSIPVSLSKTAEALGIEVPEGRHSALVDARLAREVYLAVQERHANPSTVDHECDFDRVLMPGGRMACVICDRIEPLADTGSVRS